MRREFVYRIFLEPQKQFLGAQIPRTGQHGAGAREVEVGGHAGEGHHQASLEHLVSLEQFSTAWNGFEPSGPGRAHRAAGQCEVELVVVPVAGRLVVGFGRIVALHHRSATL